MKKAIVCIFIIISVFLVSCNSINRTYEGFGFMGTYYSVSSKGGINQKKTEALLAGLEEEISAENGQLSLLNQAAEGTAVKFSKRAYTLLSFTRDFYNNPLTQGAVNATIYPLVKLWGFDSSFSALSQLQPPSEQSIAGELQNVGFEWFVFDDKNLTITKTKAEASIDAGAFGKGFALSLLAEQFSNQALLCLGGSVAAIGSDYKIGIEPPFESSEYFFASFILQKGKYCCTSGSYQRCYEYDGKAYHHILDKSGYPVQNDLRSVTVVSDNGMVSDALSTCCFILGYQQSLPLLDSFRASAVFVFTDKSVKTHKLEISIKEKEYMIK